MTISHHEVLRVTAAPTKPHLSFNITNQLKIACSTSTTADTTAITRSFLCACKNFWIGKFNAYANNWGIIHKANFPAETSKLAYVEAKLTVKCEISMLIKCPAEYGISFTLHIFLRSSSNYNYLWTLSICLYYSSIHEIRPNIPSLSNPKTTVSQHHITTSQI